MDQRAAHRFPHLQQRQCGWCAADGRRHQAREVSRCKVRVLAHEQVVRGNTEEVRDTPLGVADQFEGSARVEGAHHHRGTSEVRRRVRVAVQPTGVEERQEAEVDHRPGQVVEFGQVDRVPERHAMRDNRALRSASCARGIHDRQGIVMGQLGHHRQSGRVHSGKPVVIVRAAVRVRSVATEDDQVRRVGALHKLRCHVTELRIRDQHGGAGITHDVIKLVNREAPVERDEHRAKPGTGELHLDELDSILRIHRHTIASSDAEVVAQHCCCAPDPIVRLAPRRRDTRRSAERVDVGPSRSIWADHRVVGNPVIRRCRCHTPHVVRPRDDPSTQAGRRRMRRLTACTTPVCITRRPIAHTATPVASVRRNAASRTKTFV